MSQDTAQDAAFVDPATAAMREATERELRGLLEIYERWERLFAFGVNGAALVRADIRDRAAYIREVLGVEGVGLVSGGHSDAHR